MICPDCKGQRTIINPALPTQRPAVLGAQYLRRHPGPPISIPCPGCGGSGVASCCEGAVGLASDVTNGEPE